MMEKKKMKSLIKNPVLETTINKAYFINQDIAVFPSDAPLPDNISNVIKFLFGKGDVLEQDIVNNASCLIIKRASYVLCDAKTINADWVYKEVKDD